jgi:hypothetical protein
MWNALLFGGALRDATRAIHLLRTIVALTGRAGGEFKLNELAYEMS